MNSKFLSALALAGAMMIVTGCSLVNDPNAPSKCSGNACTNSQQQTTGTGPACVPSCAGKGCGDDGCGGSCSECYSYEYCSNYQCLAKPVDNDTGNSQDTGSTQQNDSGASSTDTGSNTAVCKSKPECSSGTRCECVDGSLACWYFFGGPQHMFDDGKCYCTYDAGTHTTQYCEGGACSGKDWDEKSNFKCPIPTTAPAPDPDCNDGNACTADSYNANTKACVHTSIVCDYGCDSASGCKSKPAPAKTGPVSFFCITKGSLSSELYAAQGCGVNASTGIFQCEAGSKWTLDYNWDIGLYCGTLSSTALGASGLGQLSSSMWNIGATAVGKDDFIIKEPLYMWFFDSQWQWLGERIADAKTPMCSNGQLPSANASSQCCYGHQSWNVYRTACRAPGK